MTIKKKKRIVVLVSGGGSNLQSLIDNTTNGSIDGEITAVISNQKNAYALQRADKHNIPSCVISHKEFPDRQKFDRQLIKAIDSFQPDLILLAGFMRILGSEFVSHYYTRLLNIHPSLLPALPGLHTHQQALAQKRKVHGCSVHFVIPELDAGPIIVQASVPVYENDSEASLAARVLKKEHIIYPLCVRWFCEGNLTLRDGSIYVKQQKLHSPLQLDAIK